MKRSVVIVAGGMGRRMAGDIPKQFVELDGKPLVVHTLEKFIRYDPDIKVVLVLAADHHQFWDRITSSFEWTSGIHLAQGGKTRHASVKSGLQFVEDDLIVGIHDAVRPLVSLSTLERCFTAASEEDSGIPVLEVDETIRKIGTEGQSAHLDRTMLRRVQTPQVFKSEMIKKAYGLPYDPAFTDDASVFESLYGRITLVEGNLENIKITTLPDLQFAMAFIRTME